MWSEPRMEFDGGVWGGGALSHQKPRNMKAAPSSGPHYWHTDISDIFFSFCETIGPFDLWRGIKSFAAQKLQMKR